MRLTTTAILSLLAVPFVAAQVNIYHRLYHPTAAQAPFTPRGTIHIDQDSVHFTRSESFAKDISSYAEALHTVKDNHLLLYQVALERKGDTTETQWDISSVKLCHLHLAISESILLHVQDLYDPKPHAVDYFVSPIPHNGACSKRSKTDSAPFHTFAKNLNTTVALRGASLPPLPLLTTPPPLSAEGAPIVPVPEKSFLQKYWMYMVGLVMFTLITSGGGEEEQPKK